MEVKSNLRFSFKNEAQKLLYANYFFELNVFKGQNSKLGRLIFWIHIFFSQNNFEDKIYLKLHKFIMSTKLLTKFLR